MGSTHKLILSIKDGDGSVRSDRQDIADTFADFHESLFTGTGADCSHQSINYKDLLQSSASAVTSTETFDIFKKKCVKERRLTQKVL